MPAAVGYTSLALVVGVCVALTEMLDVAGTSEDDGQAEGRYIAGFHVTSLNFKLQNY